MKAKLFMLLLNVYSVFNGTVEATLLPRDVLNR